MDIGSSCETCWMWIAAVIVAALVVPSCGAGQEARIKHPVLDHGVDAGAAAQSEQAVAVVMSMSEQEMLSYMPEKHYSRFCHCPKCFGGVDADGVFSWDFRRPNELKCKFCGFVWTPDGEYREDQVLSGKNLLGETRTFNYYYDEAHKTQHFFTANIDFYKRGWITSQLPALGRAYLATGKPEYARRAALILDKMAQVYQHLAVIKVGGCPNRYFRFADSQEPPYTWDAGKWGWHYPGGELPGVEIQAYDMTCDSEEFDKLSEQRGYDVREKLEKEFFTPIYEAVAAGRNHIDNYVAYLGTAARMGRVLNRPDWVHWAFRWIGENVNAGCFYDGMWHESPSYHYMTTGGLRSCFASVRGYTDPAGYADKVDGTRYDDLDAEKVLPFWAKVQHAPEVLDFPNGCSTVVHDTWPGEQRSRARQRTVSTILPGFGHASLGRGTGGAQMQAQVHFSGGYGHSHRDNLTLTLWAKEREMLSDIGYTWSDIRWWAGCTIAHNLVAVDCQEQGGGPSDGDLLWFFPDSNGVSVVEADGKRGYGNIAGLDMYRRLLVLMPVSEQDAYVVDIFRTRGGSVHDWLMHGDASEDMAARCSLELGATAGDMAAVPPEGIKDPAKGYTVIRGVRNAAAKGPFEAVFTYAADAKRGVRIHVVPDGPVQAFLGQSPSVRRVGIGTSGDSRKIFDFWMPQLVVRRTGEAPLASTFAAVEEAFAGRTFVDSVEAVRVEPAEAGVTGLRIKHGDTVDTIISTLDEAPYPERTAAGDIRMKGRLGVVRQRGDEVLGLWLFEGEELAAGKSKVACEGGRYEGAIEAATRKADGAAADAFITDAELPAGGVLHGCWMIVTHGNGYTHGYQIDQVKKDGGKTVIVLAEDHGLRIEGGKTQEVYFPRRGIEGENTFVIPVAASMSREL